MTPRTQAATRRQSRGLETLERLLIAAEELLEEHLFEQISVQQIVGRARATVGSFYHLLGDKEALLEALYERACARTLDGLARDLDPVRWADADLEQMLRGLVAALLRLYRRERGLMRALVLRAHCRGAASRAERPAAMDSVIPRVAELVASRSDEIGHPRPAQAAALGFLAVLATARECLLYPDTSAYVLQLGERTLGRELTQLWLSYLQGGR